MIIFVAKKMSTRYLNFTKKNKIIRNCCKKLLAKLFHLFSHIFTLFKPIFHFIGICKLNPISGILHLVHFHAQHVLFNKQNYD